MKDQLEVGSLSRQVTLKPVSLPLQEGIRFFQSPLPANLSMFLTKHLLSFKTIKKKNKSYQNQETNRLTLLPIIDQKCLRLLLYADGITFCVVVSVQHYY